MKILTVDQKRRLVLPGAEPGEAFCVRQLEAGRYELLKMIPQPRGEKPPASKVEELLETEALTPRMSWEQLKAETRDP